MKNVLYSVCQALLLAVIGKNPGATGAAALDNFSYIKDGTLYLRTDAVTGIASGRVELLDANTKSIVGLSTFDGMKLKAGQRFLLEQIRFGTAEVVNTNVASAAAQVYSTKLADCPQPLRGANLVISQGGVVKVDMPISRLLTNGPVEKNVGEDGYYLQTPRMLEPELETLISIRFPDGGAGLTNTANKRQLVEIMLIGPEASV